METPIPDYLEELLGHARPDDSGHRADYIPELAKADPDKLAVALATLDGQVYAVGDADYEFTIQSISKPFVYAKAIADRGLDEVLKKVGVEPSGDAFNEISIDDEGRPCNPMINAGAITTHSLVGGPDMSQEERDQEIVTVMSAFAGRDLAVNETVKGSELDTAHRNLGIAYLLRSQDIIESDPAETVTGYVRQCSFIVTTRDLAIMAATLANTGKNPITGEQVVPESVVRQVLSVMTTCGMYDAAGDWVTQVGIPAKSGVAGGIIGGLPGQLGAATFSPRLDEHGNSLRGVKLFEQLSDDMGMHMLEVPPLSRSVIRGTDTVNGVRIVEIQGALRFASAERIVREFDEIDEDLEEDAVALDMRGVSAMNKVASRMILEMLRRLALDGKKIFLIDPDAQVPDVDLGDAGEITVVNSKDQLRD